VPASLASTSFYLIPVFGVAAGSVLLGDRLESAQWIGVAIVAIAVGANAVRPTNLHAPAPATSAEA
jgi:drug/metabolite transporter (DMT)-like permease